METNQSLPECCSDICRAEDRKDLCKLSPCLSGSSGDPARLLPRGFHRARVMFLLASVERPDVCLFCHIVRVYVERTTMGYTVNYLFYTIADEAISLFGVLCV